jgi:hypothetical protein
MWTNRVVTRGSGLLTWPTLMLPRGMCGAHLCWHGPIGLWHVAPGCWPSPLWCCHVAHPLSSFIFILSASHTQFVPRVAIIPQVVPRVALIKSHPLINPFNLFYLPWIYFNSSTYPKIMKISPKISKFMMIIPVIFNSIFTPVSLN